MDGWVMAQAPINSNGITKLLPAVPRYLQQSKFVQPVLCVADVDNNCAKQVVQSLFPNGCPDTFLFRLAVREAESWVMADRDGLAHFLSVPKAKVPHRPDELENAKRELLKLARSSRNKLIRQDMISPSNSYRSGSGYNVQLRNFVVGSWEVGRAAQNSPSLSRAVARLQSLSSAR